MFMSKFKPGDKVYCLHSFGYIEEGVIKKCEDTVETTIPVPKIYAVVTDVGQVNFLEEDVFKTYGDAILAKAGRSRRKREEYESKINNLPQLFSFMVSHMYCEEYTDLEAIQASKNKIKEITGIDMDGEWNDRL